MFMNPFRALEMLRVILYGPEPEQSYAVVNQEMLEKQMAVFRGEQFARCTEIEPEFYQALYENRSKMYVNL